MAKIKVVGDEKELKEFYDTLVQPLQEDQVYVIIGVARKKYSDTLSRSEETLMKEIIVDDGFYNFLRTLKKFEVDETCYLDRNTKNKIPSKAMAWYIDLCPKSSVNALSSFFKEHIDDVVQCRTDPNRLISMRRMKSHFFSHTSKSNAIRVPYKIIDIDDKVALPLVLEDLDKEHIPIKWISETRGGYHILIEVGGHLERFYRHVWPISWEVDGQEKIEMLKSSQTPIVGTYQGGKLVKRWRK